MFNRPEWKVALSYSHLENASLRRFAWEFLRRNPEYQRDWSEFTMTAQQSPHGEDCSIRTEQGISPLVTHLGRRWGLSWIHDPSKDSGPDFLERGAIYHLLVPGCWPVPQTAENPHRMQQFSRHLILQLDLSLPLEVLEAAAAAAIRGQRSARIARGVFKPVDQRAQANRLYIEYLRVLDGDEARATVREIGEAVAPHAENSEDRQRDKRIRGQLKEAKRLQESGYLVLPLLEAWKSKGKKK